MTVLIRTILVSCSLSFVPCDAGSQEPGQIDRPTPNQIVATIGRDAAAGGMVARAIRNTLESIRAVSEIAVEERQIRTQWLPLVQDVTYIVLDDEQAKAFRKSCGSTLFLGSFTRRGDDVSISVGYGDSCRGFGVTTYFRRTLSGWDEAHDLGGGFSSGVDHCSCPAT